MNLLNQGQKVPQGAEGADAPYYFPPSCACVKGKAQVHLLHPTPKPSQKTTDRPATGTRT